MDMDSRLVEDGANGKTDFFNGMTEERLKKIAVELLEPLKIQIALNWTTQAFADILGHTTNPFKFELRFGEHEFVEVLCHQVTSTEAHYIWSFGSYMDICQTLPSINYFMCETKVDNPYFGSHNIEEMLIKKDLMYDK